MIAPAFFKNKMIYYCIHDGKGNLKSCKLKFKKEAKKEFLKIDKGCISECVDYLDEFGEKQINCEVIMRK